MASNSTNPNSPIEPRKDVKTLFSEFVDGVIEWFSDFFNLQEGLDREGTIIYIRNNKRIRGASAWLLMCSIMIASLGLDLNSPAVIIGAMLISPLMSPILGLGLSVAINDKESLFISFQHFLIAILIAIVTSTLYFLITPFGELTDEINARTEPTTLDGLVAVFGGLAGIISTSRKEKSSAIPGVAIATALMPPLCVTGYGIANGNVQIMLNSFYLFFLNSFFIATTAFILIKYMQFPLKTYLDRKEERRTRWIIGIFSLILILPSASLLWDLYNKRQDERKVEAFIRDTFREDEEGGTTQLDYSLIKQDTINRVVIKLLGETISRDSVRVLEEKLKDYGLKNARLIPIQNTGISVKEFDRMEAELSNNLDEFEKRIELVNQEKSQAEQELDALQARLDSLSRDTIAFKKICDQAKAVFPKLQSLSYGKATQSRFDSTLLVIPTFLIEWERGKSRSQKTLDEKKLYGFLKVTSELDTLQIITY